MQESDTYLMILDEGAERQARKTVLLLGEDRLEPASEAVRSRLESIEDLARLNRMILRAAKAGTWQEILDTP